MTESLSYVILFLFTSCMTTAETDTASDTAADTAADTPPPVCKTASDLAGATPIDASQVILSDGDWYDDDTTPYEAVFETEAEWTAFLDSLDMPYPDDDIDFTTHDAYFSWSWAGCDPEETTITSAHEFDGVRTIVGTKSGGDSEDDGCDAAFQLSFVVALEKVDGSTAVETCFDWI